MPVIDSVQEEVFIEHLLCAPSQASLDTTARDGNCLSLLWRGLCLLWFRSWKHPPPPDREQGWDDLGEAMWPAGAQQGEEWPAGFSQWSGKAPRRKC